MPSSGSTDPSIKAFFVINPGNPDSRAISHELLRQLHDLIVERRPDLVIIADTAYAAFLPDFHGALADVPRNIIYIYSFSKTFGATGNRLGVVAVHRDNVLDDMLRAQDRRRPGGVPDSYRSVASDPRRLTFLDRMVADSRDSPCTTSPGWPPLTSCRWRCSRWRCCSLGVPLPHRGPRRARGTRGRAARAPRHRLPRWRRHRLLRPARPARDLRHRHGDAAADSSPPPPTRGTSPCAWHRCTASWCSPASSSTPRAGTSGSRWPPSTPTSSAPSARPWPPCSTRRCGSDPPASAHPFPFTSHRATPAPVPQETPMTWTLDEVEKPLPPVHGGQRPRADRRPFGDVTHRRRALHHRGHAPARAVPPRRAPPDGPRLVDVQKCVRTDDIDEVGDIRHLTFFEMLGNWSLGDYFKSEPSLRRVPDSRTCYGFSPDLYVTVFAGDADVGLGRDDEAAAAWEQCFAESGVDPTGHITPRKDNWWSNGPAGPAAPTPRCSSTSATRPPPTFADTRRFVEIWNNVFMTYERDADGTLTELSERNIDTGMGAERTELFLNNRATVWETPEMAALLDAVLPGLGVADASLDDDAIAPSGSSPITSGLLSPSPPPALPIGQPPGLRAPAPHPAFGAPCPAAHRQRRRGGRQGQPGRQRGRRRAGPPLGRPERRVRRARPRGDRPRGRQVRQGAAPRPRSCTARPTTAPPSTGTSPSRPPTPSATPPSWPSRRPSGWALPSTPVGGSATRSCATSSRSAPRG